MWNDKQFWIFFEKLRALAQTGLNYSSDTPYHNEIYQQIIALCQESLTHRSNDEGYANWGDLLNELGVITPKAGAVVAVTRVQITLSYCLRGHLEGGVCPVDMLI